MCYPQGHPYLSLRDVSTVGCPLGKGWWERGGETLGGLANEVAVAAVLARSSPSCLPLSSAGCPGAPSPFHSWGRSVGHTAAAGDRGWLAGSTAGPVPYPGLSKSCAVGGGAGHRSPCGRAWRGPEAWLGCRLTSPCLCRLSKCCCCNCCICRSCCWKASCLFPRAWEGARGGGQRGVLLASAVPSGPHAAATPSQGLSAPGAVVVASAAAASLLPAQLP